MSAQRILVPTDFSAHADAALDYAIALAGKLQARITVFHAIQSVPLWVDGDMGRALPDVYLSQVEKEVQQGLEKRQQRIQAASVPCNMLMEHGMPFQRIIDLAREQQIDLIVMGTHGRTGLQHVLLGSVAENVVRLAPCPVLIVR
jgi:universal stress protein A